MGLLSVTTASASTVNSAGYEAINAVDMVVSANAGDRWAAASGLPQWLMLDLGSSKVADYYCIAPGGYSSTQDPSAWTFEGSNDAVSWTVISTVTSWSFSGAPKTFSVTNTTAYRYYRLNISATSGGVASVSEFRVGLNDPSAPTVTAAVTASVDNAASGTVSVASTPTAGQVVIVSAASNRTDLAVSGLGATWTKVSNSMASSWGSYTHTVWIGNGATSSGNVTVTGGGAYNAQLLALVATDCDGTNIIAMGNGATTSADIGQLVLTAVIDGGGGTPVLGGTTVPSAASWTSTSQFAATSGERIRHAYILASGGSNGAQWTGLTSAGSNAVVLGFASAVTIGVQMESVYTETLATGTASVQMESVYAETLASGTPTVQMESVFIETMTLVQPVQVESVYSETLLTSTPPSQVEAVYAETLLSTTPPVQVEATYLELLLLPNPAPAFVGWGMAI